MALTPAQLQELNGRIGWLLDKHLAPIFRPGVQLTFIARTPGNDEADVLVTTERDLNDVIALALRSLGRAAVGAGVDNVPRTDGAGTVVQPPTVPVCSVPASNTERVVFKCDNPGGCRFPRLPCLASCSLTVNCEPAAGVGGRDAN